MGSNQSRQPEHLPVSTSHDSGSQNTSSGQVLHPSINILTLLLGGLTTLISSFLAFKTSKNETLDLGAVVNLTFLDIFGISIICMICFVYATSIIRPSATTLITLHDDAIMLAVASALASLISMILQPPLRWAAYSFCMAFTLGIIILQREYWKPLYNLLESQVLSRMRSSLDAVKERLHACRINQPDIEQGGSAVLSKGGGEDGVVVEVGGGAELGGGEEAVEGGGGWVPPDVTDGLGLREAV